MIHQKDKWHSASLSKGELKKLRETKQRRVAKKLLREELDSRKPRRARWSPTGWTNP
jgi:hypothetical protein